MEILWKGAIYNERRTVRFPKCSYWIKFQYLWGGSFHAKRIPRKFTFHFFPYFYKLLDASEGIPLPSPLAYRDREGAASMLTDSEIKIENIISVSFIIWNTIVPAYLEPAFRSCLDTVFPRCASVSLNVAICKCNHAPPGRKIISIVRRRILNIYKRLIIWVKFFSFFLSFFFSFIYKLI